MTGFDLYVAWISKITSDLGSKTSSVATETVSKLPDSEFALVVRKAGKVSRTLPVHTSSALAESMAILETISGVLPPRLTKTAAQKIRERHAAFNIGIPRVIHKLSEPKEPETEHPYWTDEEEAWMQPVKTREKKSAPLAEPIHVWNLENETGEPVLSFQIRTRDDLNRAERILGTYGSKLSSTDRRRMARGIIESYEKIGLSVDHISGTLRTYAGTKVSASGPAVIRARGKEVEKGACLEERPEVRQKASEAYAALAQHLHKHGAAVAEIVAERVDTLDRQLGLHTDVPAHEAVFLPHGDKGGLFDKTSEPTDFYVVGPTMIREADLEHLKTMNLAQLRPYIGEDATEQLRKNPVGTFKGMTKAQQRIVARFTEQFVNLTPKHRQLPTFQ